MVVEEFMETQMPNKIKINHVEYPREQSPVLGSDPKKKLRGLGWCPLCKNDSEDALHLFVKCPFTQRVCQECNSMTGENFLSKETV